MAIDSRTYNLEAKYEEFNKRFFDNMLDPNMKVEWGILDGAHGHFAYSRKYVMEGGKPKRDPNTKLPIVGAYAFGSGKLVIDKKVNRTEEFLDGIMLHEMCHIWVTQVLSNPGAENGGHNDQFLAKIDEIQAKVPFLVPRTEADDSGVTGATELITISFLIARQRNGKFGFAMIANREADEWRREGYDATSDALQRIYSRQMSGADKVVLNRVTDPELSYWFVQTGQRLPVHDTISDVKPQDFKTSNLLGDKLASLSNGTLGKVLGEFVPPDSTLLNPQSAETVNKPEPTFPLLYPEEVPTGKEPYTNDGDPIYIFATLRDGMPGYLATDSAEVVFDEAETLVVNLRRNYPRKSERDQRIKSLARLIELFKALRKRSNVVKCSAADVTRATHTTAEMKTERVVALASWLDSLSPEAPPVKFNGMNGDNFKEWVATAFRNRVRDDNYATFIQDQLFGDGTPTTPTALLASILRGDTNVDGEASTSDLYMWLCQDMSLSSDLVDRALTQRGLSFSVIFATTDLWTRFQDAGRPTVKTRNDTQTYDVSADGTRPTYPNLPKAEAPTMTDQAYTVNNVFGQWPVDYAYLLAGVSATGAPLFLASNADPSADESPTSSWYVNIGKLARNADELQRGVDFAASLERLYNASVENGGRHSSYSGSDIRTHVQLAMQSGVFATDRLEKMVAWLKGLNPKVAVDTSKLTLSGLRTWLAKALDDAMGGVDDLAFVKYVLKRVGWADSGAETTLHITHRLLMMDPSFSPAKNPLTQIPLSLYLGDVFPEKFYSAAAASYWSDDDFDRIFKMTNLRADYEAEKPKAPVVETPAVTENPIPATNGKTLYANPKGDPYDRYSLILQDQPTGSMIGSDGVRSFITMYATQDVAQAEAQRDYLIVDRNDPTFYNESFAVASQAMDLDAIMRRFGIKLTKAAIYNYLLRVAQEPDFQMISDTKVKSLEQWYMQWFGEPFTYDRDLPYTHALLQLSGAIQRAERDDKGFNFYALREMQLDGGLPNTTNSVRNQALLAQLMRNFGSSSDSLGLWLLNLPPELTNELMSQGKVNFEALNYVFEQTSVATLRGRWEDMQKPPEPTVRLYKHEDLVAQGFKATGIVYESEQVPTQGFLQKAHSQLGVGADDIGAYRLAVDRWEVYLKPGVVSPVLNPESTVRPPSVPAPTGARSSLQITVDRETRKIVLREEPQDEPKGKNRIGQVNKREARPIVALLNVLLVDDFEDIASLIREGDRREAATKMGRLAERLRPYFKQTVETKQPYAGLQPWIDANFGKGYKGDKPQLHAQKQAMLAFEGVKAKLTPAQRKYLTNPQTRKEVLQLLGIKLR